MKKNRYIDQMREKNQRLTQDILHLLSITEKEYFYLRIDGATDYLRNVLGLDQWSIDQLHGYAGFWQWWNQQWTNRDREFLNEFEHAMNADQSTTTEIREFYIQEYNSMEALMERPYSAALDASYSHMISKLIKASQLEKLKDYVRH